MATNGTGSSAGESVGLLAYRPDALSLKVRSRGDSLLVLSESYYPGWKAWVDGLPATIYRTDVAFRGVYVGDGVHVVRMEFSPAILRISLGITMLTAVVLGAMMFLGVAGQRRNG
jgi:uncharacterized membrane protein YfhO